MPSSAQADLCELALRQVPKYTGHTDGGFVEGTKVGSWPIADNWCYGKLPGKNNKS